MDEAAGIVIAGGGLVGAALALGLRTSMHRVTLLEARSFDADSGDARVIALSHGSRLLLERLGAWQALTDVIPINTIVVSQQKRFGRVELSAREAGVPALGYVAGFSVLRRALIAALSTSEVNVVEGCVMRDFEGGASGALLTVECAGTTRKFAAQLTVLADGADGMRMARVEERDYRQSAVVCDITSDAPHQNRAFERFTPHGPLALLPTARGWSLVWTLPSSRAHEIIALDDAHFCAELRAAFGSSLGDLRVAGARQIFPLKLKYARRAHIPRVVLIGNAAQSLHPVAGQGFNLGLRDAWELAVALRTARDPGDFAILNNYFNGRRFDRTATILFTDTLIRLFSHNIPLLDRLAGAGFIMLGGISPAKNFLVRRMMFGTHG